MLYQRGATTRHQGPLTPRVSQPSLRMPTTRTDTATRKEPDRSEGRGGGPIETPPLLPPSLLYSFSRPASQPPATHRNAAMEISGAGPRAIGNVIKPETARLHDHCPITDSQPSASQPPSPPVQPSSSSHPSSFLQPPLSLSSPLLFKLPFQSPSFLRLSLLHLFFLARFSFPPQFRPHHSTRATFLVVPSSTSPSHPSHLQDTTPAPSRQTLT